MKKRILFVDDDPVLREIYTLMLKGKDEKWEVSTAEDALHALEFMERTPVDVIVSDLRMPGMNGAELIREVRRQHPGTSRIILSGLSDQEEVAKYLGDTHQFLAKPLEAKTLRDTLARLCGLDAYLQDEKLKVLFSQLDALPSFPSLYLEIMKELAADDPSSERVADIIAKDPGMTAKMLQIVNSAAFGLKRRIGNTNEAVQFLGMGTVRSLALSTHVFSCFERTALKGSSIDQLWDHAIKTAVVVRMIMQLEVADLADTEDAYTAGMLHDIGKLMLAHSLPDEFQKATALSAERNIPLHEAELEVFHATHAGVGAHLLGLWGLPAAIVEAVAFHHTPRISDMQRFGPLAAVHVANALEPEFRKVEMCGPPATVDSEYLAALGVADRMDEWREAAGKILVTGEA